MNTFKRGEEVMCRRRLIVVVAFISGLLLLPFAAVGDPPDTATMQFGKDVGSPFPPPDDHDESTHAKDSIVPREVVISQGGTVTFNIVGSAAHQVAIYQPGTKAADIDVTSLTNGGVGCPPVPLINDQVGLIAVLGDQPCAGGPLSPSFTFNEPGRYLIICKFLPHFADNDMYGWVRVK